MDHVAIQAAQKPDAIALVEDDRCWTWAEFLERRNRVANSLMALGLGKGDRTVTYAHNSLECLLAPAAARAAGATAVPMNHRLVADEVSYILDHSDATTVFVGDSFLPVIEQVRAGAAKVRHWVLMGEERRPWARSIAELVSSGAVYTPPDDPELGLGGSMIYTGGTTGRPKGAYRDASDPNVSLGYMRALGMMHPDHVHLVAGPLYHSAPGSFAT